MRFSLLFYIFPTLYGLFGSIHLLLFLYVTVFLDFLRMLSFAFCVCIAVFTIKTQIKTKADRCLTDGLHDGLHDGLQVFPQFCVKLASGRPSTAVLAFLTIEIIKIKFFQTRRPSSMHSQKRGKNCRPSCKPSCRQSVGHRQAISKPS